jgi:putative membrane protein
MFQKEADNGKNADLKAFATKTLPTLNHHLEMVKGIQKKM